MSNDENAPKPVTLETPIARGKNSIEQVLVRKPKSGELRGVQLVNLLNMDVASLEIVLPRITIPTLTKQEIADLDPADITQLGAEVCGFLLTKRAKQDFPAA